jgi:beta-hydroxylase
LGRDRPAQRRFSRPLAGAPDARVVLLIQFARPLRQPAKWIAEVFLGFVRRSAFVQEARANIDRWNAAMAALDS